MTFVKLPLIGAVLLLVVYVLSTLSAPALQATLQSVPAAQRAAYPAISEGGSFDPEDLCRRYNAAFKAAGVPNFCTTMLRYQVRSNIGVVEMRHDKEVMFQIDYGVDWSETYGHYNLPAGKRVWQTALRVFTPYNGKGMGSTIVENYDMLLRALGAQSGDIELLVASPAKSMPQAARLAWEDFVARICLKWNATPIDSITPGIGCWRILP